MRWLPVLVVVVALGVSGVAAAKPFDSAQVGFDAKVLGYELQAEDAVAAAIEEQYPTEARSAEHEDAWLEARAEELVTLAGEAHAAANAVPQMEVIVGKIDRRRDAVLLADKRMVHAAEQVGVSTRLGTALTHVLATTLNQIVAFAG